MEKILCDRCGKIINVNEESEKYYMNDMPFHRITKITYDKEHYKKKKVRIDLCYGCQNELSHFLYDKMKNAQMEVFSWYENNKSHTNS